MWTSKAPILSTPATLIPLPPCVEPSARHAVERARSRDADRAPLVLDELEDVRPCARHRAPLAPHIVAQDRAKVTSSRQLSARSPSVPQALGHELVDHRRWRSRPLPWRPVAT